MSTSYTPARCPACAGEATVTVASSEAIRAEVEALWGFHLRRLRPGTPPERLYDRVVFSQRPPLAVVACATCGTLFRDPVEHASGLEETYAEEEVESEVLQALHDAQRQSYRAQAERLTRIAGGPGTGIEVGSYVGGFLSAASEAGWRFTGVDVNEATNRFAREHGGPVVTGTIHAVRDERGRDAVALWNCFEQLADPRATLETARSILRPGGVLALRVPNGAFYAALRPRLEGALGPIARAALATNNLLGFPYRYGFTPAALRRLVEARGFETIRVVSDTLVPTADRWTRPWAALEERALKAMLRLAGRWTTPPWFELYARRRSG